MTATPRPATGTAPPGGCGHKRPAAGNPGPCLEGAPARAGCGGPCRGTGHGGGQASSHGAAEGNNARSAASGSVLGRVTARGCAELHLPAAAGQPPAAERRQDAREARRES